MIQIRRDKRVNLGIICHITPLKHMFYEKGSYIEPKL